MTFLGGFIVGMIVGGIVGVMVAALAVISRDKADDEEQARYISEIKDKNEY